MHESELVQIERRFSSSILGPIIIGLRVGYPRLLRLLDDLGLALCRRGHESDQRIPHGLLHRVLRGPVEDQPIDGGRSWRIGRQDGFT